MLTTVNRKIFSKKQRPIEVRGKKKVSVTVIHYDSPSDYEISAAYNKISKLIANDTFTIDEDEYSEKMVNNVKNFMSKNPTVVNIERQVSTTKKKQYISIINNPIDEFNERIEDKLS